MSLSSGESAPRGSASTAKGATTATQSTLSSSPLILLPELMASGENAEGKAQDIVSDEDSWDGRAKYRYEKQVKTDAATVGTVIVLVRIGRMIVGMCAFLVIKTTLFAGLLRGACGMLVGYVHTNSFL